jgi:membrane protease subunit (stomatin/prohibitin family)
MYTWDASSAPSCFGSSGFLDGAKQSIADLWNRIKAGGEIPMQQRVYFVNMLEIMDNKFGSAAPIDYPDPEYMNIEIRLHGTFSFRIENPVTFFKSVVGNVADDYTRSELADQIKTEFMLKISEALNKLGSVDRIRYNYLLAEQTRLKIYMNEALDEEWLEGRGMVVVSAAIGGLSPSDASKEKIKKYDDTIFMSSGNRVDVNYKTSVADAMKTAAANESGAMNTIIGMGILDKVSQSAGGAVVGTTQQAPGVAPAGQTETTVAGWTCAKCGATGNPGKYCAACGDPLASQAPWTCYECGAQGNKGKFCSDCGKPKPAPAECKECGWKGEAGAKKPKFCPECGKPIE